MLKRWKRATVSGGDPPTVGPPSAVPGVAFEGLDEPDLVALYNAGEIRRLAAGAILFKVSDLADVLYLVISGRIEARDPPGGSSEVFRAGDWIDQVDFDEPFPHRTTALAQEPASVLILTKGAFAGLNHDLQLMLLDRLWHLSQARLRRLGVERDALARRNTDLTEALYRLRAGSHLGFAKTDLAQQIIAKVPRLPVSTTNLLNKLLDEGTRRVEVVELVKSDPSLTSVLLKSINSPLYGLNHRVADVNHAIGLLGFDAVYQIIMSESMRQCLPDTPLFREIYQRSLEVSQLAFAISQEVNVAKPVEIATIGILNDIGRLVIELLKTGNPRLIRVFESINPGELGAELLRSWNLPESICKSIQYRHHPEFATPQRLPADVLVNVATIYLAHRCYDLIHAVEVDQPPLFMEEYLAVLGLAGTGDREFLYQRVAPRLRTRLQTLPRSLASILAG